MKMDMQKKLCYGTLHQCLSTEHVLRRKTKMDKIISQNIYSLLKKILKSRLFVQRSRLSDP